MRVLNDKNPEEQKLQEESKQTDFVLVLLYALYIAMGIGTVFLGIVPMISAHQRLAEPWSKASVLLGAVIALVFPLALPLPATQVLLIFVVGLFVSDRLSFEKNIWRLIIFSSVLGLVVSLGIAISQSVMADQGVWQYWVSKVSTLLSSLNTSESNSVDPKTIETLRGVLLYSAPMMFFAEMLVIVWISIGFASHLGWFPVKHFYTPNALRKLKLPREFGLAFFLVLASSMLLDGIWKHFSVGVLGVLGAFLFIKGSVFISKEMARRKISFWPRTLIYGLIVIPPGMFATAGIGLVSHWFLKRRESR